MTFADLCDGFFTEEKSSTSPQNNPQYAYRYKRRNLCLFEDYLKFMGLKAIKRGNGPDGSETVLSIGSDADALLPNTMLEDRARLGMYYGAKDIIPGEEQVGKSTPNMHQEESREDGTQQQEEDGFDTTVRDTLFEVASSNFKRYIYV